MSTVIASREIAMENKVCRSSVRGVGGRLKFRHLESNCQVYSIDAGP